MFLDTREQVIVILSQESLLESSFSSAEIPKISRKLFEFEKESIQMSTKLGSVEHAENISAIWIATRYSFKACANGVDNNSDEGKLAAEKRGDRPIIMVIPTTIKLTHNILISRFETVWTNDEKQCFTAAIENWVIFRIKR